MNKQKGKIKEIILGYSSDCGFDMDGVVDELSGLMDSIREETLREVEKEDIGFLFLTKMKETNGNILKSVNEVKNEIINNLKTKNE